MKLLAPLIVALTTMQNPQGIHQTISSNPKSEVVVSWFDSTHPGPIPYTTSYGRIGYLLPEVDKGIELGWEYGYFHIVLGGLRPEEKVNFILPGLQDTVHATTFPAAMDTITFSAFGDQGTGLAAEWIARAVSADHRAMFNIVLGDMAYANLPYYFDGSDIWWWEQWNNWFIQNQVATLYKPWVYVVGNHENEWTGSRGRWTYEPITMRVHQPETERHFLIDIPPLAILVIDTNQMESEYGVEQLAWVEDTLESLSVRSDVDWIVAAYHHNTDVQERAGAIIRSYLVPLLEDGGVDMVLSGHDHLYRRHTPMWDNLPTGEGCHEEYSDTPGILYVTSGGGGQNLGRETWTDTTCEVAPMHHFLHVEITEQSADIWSVGSFGGQIDHVRLEKSNVQ